MIRHWVIAAALPATIMSSAARGSRPLPRHPTTPTAAQTCTTSTHMN
jgi:hypothetical protein